MFLSYDRNEKIFKAGNHLEEKYDVIVIGAGISGLTAGALLAKRGMKVAVLEAAKDPGGSCGIFKRDQIIYEQGAAMLYGFGPRGFNPHRFVFNVLEEPITMIKHDALYMIHFGADDITFYEDMELFLKELIRVFPEEEKGIRRFYKDMTKLYEDVIVSTPLFVSPDVISSKQASKQFKEHPYSYLKFLSYMNRNMKWLLQKYFKGDKILRFFDKMTSTYCYSNVEEAPAVLGAVMLVDNHVGGSYYPAGSTLQMIGKLEKSIEEHGGDVICQCKVSHICIKNMTAIGVRTEQNKVIKADAILYSGNIWALYEDMLYGKKKCEYEPSYSSLVLYALIQNDCIPDDALPIEMFVSEKDKIDESEITTYLMSIDDHTLCPAGYHVLTAIGPSFRNWPEGHGEWYGTKAYEIQKEREMERMIAVLQRRYRGIRKCIVYSELATPSTLMHYCRKYHGSVAGPKQKIGQHMMKRQHVKTDIDGLYCCGEGTIMGTGTPAVTVSAISAANYILRKAGRTEYSRDDVHCDYVTIVKPPYQRKETNPACRCNFCEHAKCEEACPYGVKISEINRKLSVFNITGAKKLLMAIHDFPCKTCKEKNCENVCPLRDTKYPVPICELLKRTLNQPLDSKESPDDPDSN